MHITRSTLNIKHYLIAYFEQRPQIRPGENNDLFEADVYTSCVDTACLRAEYSLLTIFATTITTHALA
jgi:hypothetical protein